MTNKILIYSSEDYYTHHKCIIDKDDLEAYIQNHVKEFTKDSSKRTILFEYIAHEVTKFSSIGEGQVIIKYLQHAYTILNATYKEQDYYDSFEILDLDKMPTWQAQPKTLNNNIKTNSMTPTKIPSSISINEIEFSQLQIENIPQIKSIQQYIEIPAENPNMKPDKVPGRIEFLPIELNLFATMDQIEKIRSVFSASTNSQNPETIRKPDILKMVYANTTTHVEGFLRDLSYPVELEYPNYINIQMSFVVNNVTTN